MLKFSRRSWLRATGLASLAGGLGAARQLAGQGLAGADSAAPSGSLGPRHGHRGALQPRTGSMPRHSCGRGTSTTYPQTSVRSFIAKLLGQTARYSACKRFTPPIARSRSHPGSSFPRGPSTARSPGPTIRATEGDHLRITFRNLGLHPHSMHFHGWHPPAMDGALAGQED